MSCVVVLCLSSFKPRFQHTESGFCRCLSGFSDLADLADFSLLSRAEPLRFRPTRGAESWPTARRTKNHRPRPSNRLQPPIPRFAVRVRPERRLRSPMLNHCEASAVKQHAVAAPCRHAAGVERTGSRPCPVRGSQGHRALVPNDILRIFSKETWAVVACANVMMQSQALHAFSIISHRVVPSKDLTQFAKVHKLEANQFG